MAHDKLLGTPKLSTQFEDPLTAIGWKQQREQNQNDCEARHYQRDSNQDAAQPSHA